MRVGDFQRETKEHCKALLQSHLFYIHTGVAPTEYNESKIRNEIDGRIDAIPDRIAAFVEDLQALHESDVYGEDDWPDLWSSLSNPEPRNAAYADIFAPTSDVDKQALQTGLQLGHLARLLIQFSGQSADKQRKNRQAALAGFTLGIKAYGLTSVDTQYPDIEDDVLHHDNLGGDKLFGLNELGDGLQSIEDFGIKIENGLVEDQPKFPEMMKDDIANAGLNPNPPVVNAVYDEFNSRQVVTDEIRRKYPEIKGYPEDDDGRQVLVDPNQKFEVAIETIQQEYATDRIKRMCSCLQEDIPQLMEDATNIGKPEVPGAEVLYAASLNSESDRDIHDIIKDNRGGDRKKIKKSQSGSVLKVLKGTHSQSKYWEDYPIISSDNTSNAYGQLIAMIIFDDKRIRTTDQYLPTTINDETADDDEVGKSFNDFIINPKPQNIRKACYAIGLDGPSIDEIDGSWAALFNDAYRIRIGK